MFNQAKNGVAAHRQKSFGRGEPPEKSIFWTARTVCTVLCVLALVAANWSVRETK